MTNPPFSVCMATHGRVAPLKHTLESLFDRLCPDEVVVCIDACDQTRMILPDLVEKFPKVQWLTTERQIGPGRAKDLAIRKARNELCLIIDDDIEFIDVAGLSETIEALDEYALVQSGIYDGSGTRRRSFEYPSRLKWKRHRFEISYFVGAIHWLRRSAFLRVGGYGDFEGYGFEELALSIRLLREDERMLYLDSVRIKHFRSPAGRRDPRAVSLRMMENRFIIAEKFYPAPLALSQKSYWCLRHFLAFREVQWPKITAQAEKLTWVEIIRRPRLAARMLF
ncbi:glycosyltransferase family 2 protein [Pelagibacterium halotolerans]|uniref:glycosyltransferase family 2 protein n=1 Tax=Pelagibacterium halotolerans TaxID=531813 RepID=UPI00089591E9|nr:glycosyltransferase [Pelagibacterium halotolerans]QJR17218.1 glycosyltransferase [Pelagibacterium halotolerans]SEA88823.1 Glycosyltransferase, GT2 family [Pelagibacterium halotolerans]